jgi:hypothetical protein
VRVEEDGTDRHGRILGTVIVGSTDVNALLVRSGAAWVYLPLQQGPALVTLPRAVSVERSPEQLVQLHVVLGGVGLELAPQAGRDAEVQRHDLLARRPLRGAALPFTATRPADRSATFVLGIFLAFVLPASAKALK